MKSKGLQKILQEVEEAYNKLSEKDFNPKCEELKEIVEDLKKNIQELQSIIYNKEEFKNGLIELNRLYLPDYIKLLEKHYMKPKKRRKKHKREEILEYFNKIKDDFPIKKNAIRATANHFDITPQAVEKHLYNL